METTEAKAVAFSRTYENQVYVPVSFALCMIALNFPPKPTNEQISTYQVWMDTLLQVLPLAKFGAHKELCNRAQTSSSFRTRKQMVSLVHVLHKSILGTDLDMLPLLQLFSGLRAQECKAPSSHTLDAPAANAPEASGSSSGKEAGCVRAMKKGEAKTCCVVLFSHPRGGVPQTKNVPDSCFQVAANVQLPLCYPAPALLEHQWVADHSFCSCYFSAKWFLLHLVASAFPTAPSSHEVYLYHTFLNLFGNVLACASCRVNFKSNLELSHYHPKQDLASTATFVAFLHTLHDNVNNMLQKPITTSVIDTTRFYDLLHQCLHEDATYEARVLIVREEDAPTRFYLEP